MILNQDCEFSKSRVYINTHDYKGEPVRVGFDPFLYGLVLGSAKRRQKNWHSVILISGDVGDGKSTLGDGICGLDSYINNVKYNLDNVVFSTGKFEEFCDMTNNFNQALKYDEAIEGATNQDMARSNKGLSFKKKIIQKRKKKHLYVLCIDELEEYAWKLIKMADAWIHVKAFGLERGYFDMTTNKQKIKAKYLALKNKQYKVANSIMPDKTNCRFSNYENIFINDDDYQLKKDEETKSQEAKKEDSLAQMKKDFINRASNLTARKTIQKGKILLTQEDIGYLANVSAPYVGKIQRQDKKTTT